MLTLKEAAATSVLSTRWTKLWKSSVTVLNFDAGEVFRGIACLNPPYSSDEVQEKRRWYINWVNGVLRQLQDDDGSISPVISKFRVQFFLEKECNSGGDMDRWLEFALISKRVESLELFYFTNNRSHHYVFPEACFDHIKTRASDIKLLRSLSLGFVDVRGEVVEHFVANCPLLERLVVYHSHSLVNLRLRRIRALKYLEVNRCEPLRVLEIGDAPKLTHLHYHGVDDPTEELMVHDDCHRLVELTLGFDFCSPEMAFRALSAYVGRVRTLTLKMHTAIMFPSNLAELTCVERLTLKSFPTQGHRSILGWTTLINACPRLHTLRVLVVTTMSQEKSRLLREPAVVNKVKRTSIKEVEIVGFNGFDLDCEFVEYAFEYFIGLERFAIDRGLTIPDFCGVHNWFCTEEQAHIAKERALEFKTRTPPTLLEFVII
ncbi:unnamed protein product [Linum tenue]|uniref:At1g61320/AtMIF1 LRR domain-containing protein n=1 Tax=Linum tenue TaxID=586396 RepID=A0AAV0PG22_9ROSI|nr:unnamed protein product [Linum tenue]